VVRTKSQTIVWVIGAPGSLERRALREGDEYLDGWKVKRIGDQEVTLRRAGEEHTIPIVSAPATGQEG